MPEFEEDTPTLGFLRDAVVGWCLLSAPLLGRFRGVHLVVWIMWVRCVSLQWSWSGAMNPRSQRGIVVTVSSRSGFFYSDIGDFGGQIIPEGLSGAL